MNDEKDFDFEDKENPLDSQVYSTDKERRDFLQDNYPKSLGAVSRKWLSALLQKELTAHSVSKILEAGVTSCGCRTIARPGIAAARTVHCQLARAPLQF
jgi:hypothetical protein